MNGPTLTGRRTMGGVVGDSSTAQFSAPITLGVAQTQINIPVNSVGNSQLEILGRLDMALGLDVEVYFRPNAAVTACIGGRYYSVPAGVDGWGVLFDGFVALPDETQLKLTNMGGNAARLSIFFYLKYMFPQGLVHRHFITESQQMTSAGTFTPGAAAEMHVQMTSNVAPFTSVTIFAGGVNRILATSYYSYRVS